MHKIFFTFLFFFSLACASQGQEFPQFIQLPDEIKAVIFDYSIGTMPETDKCGPLWRQLGIIDKSISLIDKKREVFKKLLMNIHKVFYKYYDYKPTKMGILAALNQYSHLQEETKQYITWVVRKLWWFKHLETIGWDTKHPYFIEGEEYEQFVKDIKISRNKCKEYWGGNKIILISGKQLNLENNAQLYAQMMKNIHANMVFIRGSWAHNFADQTGKYRFDSTNKVMILDNDHQRSFLITSRIHALTFEHMLISQCPFFEVDTEQYTIFTKMILDNFTDHTKLGLDTFNEYAGYLQKHIEKLPDGLAMTKEQMYRRLNIIRGQKVKKLIKIPEQKNLQHFVKTDKQLCSIM